MGYREGEKTRLKRTLHFRKEGNREQRREDGKERIISSGGLIGKRRPKNNGWVTNYRLVQKKVGMTLGAVVGHRAGPGGCKGGGEGCLQASPSPGAFSQGG